MSKERVVCIESEWRRADNCTSPAPIKGEIYTINAIIEKKHGTYYGLEELHQDECFWAEFFRPIDSHFGEYIESTLMKDIELETVLNEM